MKELVSVLMPAYNAGEFINEAINSVLHQTYQNFELIIVNDGSIDQTEEIIEQNLKDERVKYFKFERNLGKVAALNKAYKESKGEIIVLLAADDVLTENSIEIRKSFLNEYEAVFSNMWVCDAKLNRLELFYNYLIGNFEWENYKYKALHSNFISGGTIIIKSNLASNIFPIPPNLKFEDWWISFWTLFYCKNIKYINEPLLLYRIHGNNDNGMLLDKNVDLKLKKDYLRHLDFYEELKKKIQKNEQFQGLEQLVNYIDLNKTSKESIIAGKFIPLKLEFIKVYGMKNFLIQNLISKNLSYYFRKMKNIKKTLKINKTKIV